MERRRTEGPPIQAARPRLRAQAPLVLAMLASIIPLLCSIMMSLGILPAPSGGRMWAVAVVLPGAVAFALSYALSRRALGGRVDLPEAVRSAFRMDAAGWVTLLIEHGGGGAGAGGKGRAAGDGGLAERCLAECAGASAVGSALYLSIALLLLALSG